jgi:ribosome maturation factor RimP
MASGTPSGELAGMVEPVLDSMGYELVDVEYGTGGLLRIVIDVVGGARHVQVEDCEKVSHQLGRLFMVEGVDYDRLEISSPGLDRPLKKPSDFERFAGEKVTLRLRQPIDGRRHFTGVLRKEGAEGAGDAEGAEVAEGAEARKADGAAARWVLYWSDEPAVVPARKGKGAGAGHKGARAGRSGKGVAKAGAAARGGKPGAGGAATEEEPQGQRLEFSLDQIEKARLVPKLAF